MFFVDFGIAPQKVELVKIRWDGFAGCKQKGYERKRDLDRGFYS